VLSKNLPFLAMTATDQASISTPQPHKRQYQLQWRQCTVLWLRNRSAR
jgi:hypothetical protein